MEMEVNNGSRRIRKVLLYEYLYAIGRWPKHAQNFP